MEKDLEKEAVNLLQDYLKINTTNPPGKEMKAAHFLASILENEGINYEIYEPEDGRANLLARLESKGNKKPLLLLNHMDVVGVEPENWTTDPFSGEIKDGYIWGRGTLDMKSMGIMELLAILQAKRNEYNLSRDIIFLAVADEERGGEVGAKWMMNNHPEKINAEFVINEGSYGISDMPLIKKPVFPCSTAEKGHLWLRINSTGDAGHGSMPPDNHAIHKLVHSLEKIINSRDSEALPPEVKQLFERICSEIEPHILPKLAKLIDVFPVWPVFKNLLSRNERIRAMVKNTVSVNQLDGGYKENVVPSNASAVLDCRILPSVDAQDFISRIQNRGMLEEGDVDVVRCEPGTRSPSDTELFKAMKKAVVESYPNAVISQGLLTGGSDSRFFRRRGITSYGLIPVPIKRDDLTRIHGHDERIELDGYLKGTEIICKLVELMTRKKYSISNRS